MKRGSIRSKITIWFTAALLLVVLFTFFVIFSANHRILQKTIRDSLVETVEHNVDEIEYYSDIEGFDLLHESDHFICYGDGYLEVDDDFLDAVNEVYTALYQADGTMLYGENPIAAETGELSFADSLIRTVKEKGTVYYLFDRRLEAEGVEGLWLRGVVSGKQGDVQMSAVMRLSLVFLPLLVLAASVGGYLIAGRMLRPIQQISDTALQIEKSGDLTRRIELGPGTDELHRLADSFNAMFEKLENSFDAERQFTSDVSHELRTPMSVILSQCELSLEKQEETPEGYRRDLQVIQRQGRKMSKLIRQMLDFARMENGSEKYRKESLNLSELAAGVCEDMALIREKEILLSSQIEKDIFLCGNALLLSRMLSNLIGNAYRYGRENGWIQVTLQKKEGKILISVEDNGIGVRKEEQEKIFRRFYQSDASRTGDGMGLVLSMAREIARYHGGDITLQSEPGKGSIFCVTF